MTKEILNIKIVSEPDYDPDMSYLGEFSNDHKPGCIEHEPNDNRSYPYFHPANTEFANEDYKRMLAYENGLWNMISIHAVAEIKINDTLETIRSGGLYGIESDSDKEHFMEVGAEETCELRDMLKELGFTDSEVNIEIEMDF